MTSDINGTVIGIQGTPVSSVNPNDGYVLTYVAADSEWEPKSIPTSSGTLNNNAYFTSTGTWICPAGVNYVLCIGAGGGGGGGAANNTVYGGGGGGGSVQQTSYVNVTPNTTYTVTIGAGGSGGSSNGAYGNDGSPTTLVASSVNYFYCLGAGGGVGGEQSPNLGAYFPTTAPGGVNYSGITTTFATSIGASIFDRSGGDINTLSPASAGAGGYGGGNASYFTPAGGLMNYIGGYSGGTPGSTPNGHYYAGGGGGAGPQGNGGNGGSSASTVGGVGSNGSDASANTGGGGGGGGSCGIGGTGGNGGAGGSGYLRIVW